MENLSSFPERLKELMAFREVRADEVAAAIGIHKTNVRAWMRGDSLITLRNAVKLADYFGCSLDYLAGISDVYEEVTPRELPPFYDRLRAIMASRGVTRYQFSRETSIQDVYFTRWSKGAQPDLITVMILAQKLGVSLDYLIGRRDY